MIGTIIGGTVGCWMVYYNRAKYQKGQWLFPLPFSQSVTVIGEHRDDFMQQFHMYLTFCVLQEIVMCITFSNLLLRKTNCNMFYL